MTNEQRLAAAIASLQQVLRDYPRLGHVVTAGENLQSLLADAAEDALFILPSTSEWVGDFTFPKPVILTGGGTLIGGHVCHAPRVRLTGLTLTGNRRDQTLFIGADDFAIEDCELIGSGAGARRGILANCVRGRVSRTYVHNIWHVEDAQAIAGWDGTRDLVIEDCTLEASGENVMIGGSDPSSVSGIPSNITMRRCELSKPPAWRTLANCTCKNLFELKNAKGVLVEDVTMQYSFVDGQTGYGVLLTVRNQGGTAPFTTIEDVIMRRITLRHVAGGVQLLGSDNTPGKPSQTMKRVTLEDWTIEDLSAQWGINQRTFAMTNGGEDVTLRRIAVNVPNGVTLPRVNSIMTFDGNPWTRLTVDGCNVDEGDYGLHSPDVALGVKTLEHYAPGCVWTNNTVRSRRAETGRVIAYPAGTTVRG